MLDPKKRYLQIAFNKDLGQVRKTLPTISENERILIEAGTPFIKREGFNGMKVISGIWGGKIVADLKTIDGGIEEVELVHNAGASAATVLGSAATETIDLAL